VVKLKWEQKSKNGGFFRKNSIFFNPYIGIQEQRTIKLVSIKGSGKKGNHEDKTY
jgi:hypothetical protein